MATAHADLPFPAQVAIGRALALWFVGEAMLTMISLVSVNRLPSSARTHGLFALSGALAAATPLIANAAQMVAQPFLAIFFSSVCAALAQAGLWAIVYLLTGIVLDWLGGRPPRFETVWEHWRTGFVKGAIYGALFMAFILVAALVLRAPGAATILDRAALLIGPVGGALAFPLAQTIMGSADGTAPFFGRLKRAYRDPRGPARGVVAGLGLALAYRAGLAGYDGGSASWRWPRSERSATAASISFSTPGASSGASGGSCKAGASMRSASCSAASSPARSDGISTPPSSRS